MHEKPQKYFYCRPFMWRSVPLLHSRRVGTQLLGNSNVRCEQRKLLTLSFMPFAIERSDESPLKGLPSEFCLFVLFCFRFVVYYDVDTQFDCVSVS